MDNMYSPSLGLTVISCIFLLVGALCALVVTEDIIRRKGWRTMMGIMIPVYIINATYLGPLALYIYYRFGRPPKPASKKSSAEGKKATAEAKTTSEDESSIKSFHSSQEKQTEKTEKTGGSCCKGQPQEEELQVDTQRGCCSSKKTQPDTIEKEGECGSSKHVEASPPSQKHCHSTAPDADLEKGVAAAGQDGGDMSHCCHHDAAASRPLWATIAVGVAHCGAGCVLGDVVGEWTVWGSNATINGQSIWVELLVDYAFALLFGIFFQYWSIAPMSGQYGPMTIVRAAKADVLSLTSFEIGCFGWMVAYQVGIWNYELDMMSWTYWWQMQIGMVFGTLTAYPANYFLLKWKVKEPCC